MLSSKCNPELVKNIIDRFKKELGFIDIFNKKGLTPLLNLCCNIDQFDNEEWPVQIIELLVNAGADVNVIVNHDIILQLGGQFPNILLKAGSRAKFQGWCKIFRGDAYGEPRQRSSCNSLPQAKIFWKFYDLIGKKSNFGA